MKILIPFTQVHDALTKGYGRIGAKTKTSLLVAQLTSSSANLSLTLLG